MFRLILKAFSIVILLAIIAWTFTLSSTYASYLSFKKTPIVFQSVVMGAYVVDTQEGRTQGLSGKRFLPGGMSMLFVFDTPDKYGIWMKDMNFPLDIVWLDKYKKIVYTLSNVKPDTYPHVFYPSSEALYVVELPSGFVEANNVKVGGLFYFDL